MICHNKNIRAITVFAGAVLCLLSVMSCSEEEAENLEQIPPGVARISGSVYDSGGAPIAGAAIHAIYIFEEVSPIAWVEFVSIEAIPGDWQVMLRWTTISELNCDHFVIYKRRAGEGDFSVLTEMPGHGTTSERHDYEYLDEWVLNGTPYEYHISDVEFDGAENLYGYIVTATPGAEMPTDYALLQNYPNPVEDSASIIYGLPFATQVLLTIKPRGVGSVITLVSAGRSGGWNEQTLDMSGWSNGLYTYEMIADDTLRASQTLLKNTHDYAMLRTTSPGAGTSRDGSYSFDVAVGDSIAKRDAFYHDLGKVAIERVTLVALRGGYQSADTTLDLSERASYRINFILWPE
jgi:hypothetical protein